MNPIRTIRQEPKFDEQVSGLGVSCARLDEILEGASFALARSPESFPSIPGTLLSVLKTAVHPGAPSVRIFFTFNDEEVHLLMIEFCEDDVSPILTYEE